MIGLFWFFPKVFEYELINKLDVFNDYFIFQIVERPKENIIQNINFPIVFQFSKKQQNKNYALIIHEFKDNEHIMINLDKRINVIISSYKQKIEIK